MAMYPHTRTAIDSKRHKTTRLLFQFIADTEDSHPRCPLNSNAVVRHMHTITFEYSELSVQLPSTWYKATVATYNNSTRMVL